jgi:hypothetical protein
MKINIAVIGLLLAAGMACCDKKPSKPDNVTSTRTVTVKASGTVKQAVEKVPKAQVDSSPTPPK